MYTLGGFRERRRAVWNSLASLFTKGRRRKYEASVRLTQAYQQVFAGKPSQQDQELVLADLANVSGFYRTSPHGFSSEQLWQMDGARRVYGRIFDHLRLDEADLHALETAARREAAVDEDPNEGFR